MIALFGERLQAGQGGNGNKHRKHGV